MSEEYSKIRKRVKLKKGFFIHFGVYVIINLFLFIINFLTGGEPWFLFPLVSWGTAVAIHALAVFGFSSVGLFGDSWESKQIQAEMKKRGLEINNKKLSKGEDINIDQHLELKELEKKTKYDEQDLV